MANKRIRKECEKYYFSVEGETEQLYLQWLQARINESEKSKFNVDFYVRVEKNPLKFAKKLTITGHTEVWHLFDYESLEQEHKNNFYTTLDAMAEVSNDSFGKSITYRLGYSNFTFELWMILHKKDCNSCKSNRKQYLQEINNAYNEKFISLVNYKEEKNFNKCLKSLTLDDVKNAINRAEKIETENSKSYKVQQYKSFEFYKENPATNIMIIVKRILEDCDLL